MTDILIRNVAEADVRLIDAAADRLGLSRNEYLRRQILQDAARAAPAQVVSLDDVRRFAALSADLLDDDVMRDAWS